MYRRQEAFLVLDSSFGMNCVNRFEQFFWMVFKKGKKRFFGSDFFFFVPPTGNKSSLGVPLNTVMKCSPKSDHMFLSLRKASQIWPPPVADHLTDLGLFVRPPPPTDQQGSLWIESNTVFWAFFQTISWGSIHFILFYLRRIFGRKRGLCDWSVCWLLSAGCACSRSPNPLVCCSSHVFVFLFSSAPPLLPPSFL